MDLTRWILQSSNNKRV